MTAIEGFRTLENIRLSTELLAVSNDDYRQFTQNLALIGTKKEAREIATRQLSEWKYRAEELRTACQQLIDMIANESDKKH